MLGPLRRSLIKRVIEISCKPHGAAPITKAVPKQQQRVLLPPASPSVVEATVELLSHHPWPGHCVKHAVESLCASLAQHSQSGSLAVDSIERFCWCVVDHRVPSSAMSEESYSSLLPTTAQHPALYTAGKKLLERMVEEGVAISEEVERSLVSLYFNDPLGLLAFINAARKNGHTPSKSLYSELLVVCSQQPSLHEEARHLVREMRGKWEREEVEHTIFCATLKVARSPDEVTTIWSEMIGSGIEPNEDSSQQFLEACLRTTVEQERDDILQYSEKNKSTSFVLSSLRELVVQRAPIPLEAFERVIAACAELRQLQQAVDTFRCMTRVYGLAPTRQGYRTLFRLLRLYPAKRKKTPLSKRVALSYQILGDTVATYGGSAPSWVYVETAVLLTHLLGLQGYLQMRHLMNTRSSALSPQPWDRTDYHALLESSSDTQHISLGFHLFGEMLNLGLEPDEQTFALLLGFVNNEEEIIQYCDHLVYHLADLSSVQELRDPLLSALTRVCSTTDSQHYWLSKGVLSAATHGMLQAFLLTSHKYCIESLHSLGTPTYYSVQEESAHVGHYDSKRIGQNQDRIAL